MLIGWTRHRAAAKRAAGYPKIRPPGQDETCQCLVFLADSSEVRDFGHVGLFKNSGCRKNRRLNSVRLRRQSVFVLKLSIRLSASIGAFSIQFNQPLVAQLNESSIFVNLCASNC